MEAAIAVVFEDYADALLREGFATLRNREAALDILQDTLLKAWQACATYRGKSELFPWLKQIFRHKVIDMLRTRQIEEPLPPADEGADAEIEQALRKWRGDALPTPERALRDKRSEACYRACAERFAGDHPMAAAVIGWIAEDDMAPEQIATLLRRSPGATRQYILQCRKKAKHYFADWYALVLASPQRSEV